MATPPQRASRRARAARFSRHPPSFPAMLIALAMVFAVAWMFFVRSDEPASAPVVQGLRGTYTWTAAAAGASREEGSFGAVGSGDAGGSADRQTTALQKGDADTTDSAYSAAARTGTTVSTPDPRSGERSEQTVTVGAWPPVWNVSTRSPLDYQGLAAVVRTAVEEGDESVGIKPVKDGDRAVWRASLRLAGEQVDVVVDQQTGIVTWCSTGGETFTADVDWDSPPPAGTTYSAGPPAGTGVETVTIGPEYATTPSEAGRDAGYDPLVSHLAPDGYTLRAVATGRAGLRPVSWIGEVPSALPAHLPGATVLELYTRGLALFTVEQVGPPTMRALADVGDWREDAALGRLSRQETTLQYGAFRGTTALTWYQASGPSLFVADARRAVFVTGALTRPELIAFAEGLKPVPREQ